MLCLESVSNLSVRDDDESIGNVSAAALCNEIVENAPGSAACLPAIPFDSSPSHLHVAQEKCAYVDEYDRERGQGEDKMGRESCHMPDASAREPRAVPNSK